MITEGILNAIKSVILFFIGLLPNMELNYNNGVILGINDVIQSVSYFLPITDLLVIFGLWILTKNFHILSKIFWRIWDALPFT